MNTKTSIQLRQDRAANIAEAKDLLNKVDVEKRDMTPEEDAHYEALVKDAEKLKPEIVKTERTEWLDKEERSLQEPTGIPISRRTYATPKKTIKHGEFFRAWLLHGLGKRVSNDVRDAAAEKGIDISARELTLRAMGVGDATAGAEFVTDDWSPVVLKAQKAFGGLFNVATVINSPEGDGGAFTLPIFDSTGVKSRVLAEHTSDELTQAVTGEVVLNSWKYTTKIIPVSLDLITRASYDIENFISSSLGEAMYRGLCTDMTLGDGSAKASGIASGAATSAPAVVSGAVYGYDVLLDILAAIDSSYWSDPSFALMMHPATLLQFQSSVDLNGRNLFMSANDDISGTGLKFFLGGYPVVLNPEMAVPGNDAVTIVAGKLNAYHIRTVGSIVLKRFDEALNSSTLPKYEIGYSAYWFVDGKLALPSSTIRSVVAWSDTGFNS